jgi:hypothetical protein
VEKRSTDVVGEGQAPGVPNRDFTQEKAARARNATGNETLAHRAIYSSTGGFVPFHNYASIQGHGRAADGRST